MKRALKIAGVVIAFVVVSLGVLIAATFMGRSPIIDGFESNGVRVVKDGFVTVGVVPVGSTEVALIDAGNDATGKAILDDLKRRGLGPEAVRAILLTHGHRDHTAAVRLFPKAEVMALADDVALAEGRAGGRGPLQRLMPVRPSGFTVGRTLKDGEQVALGTAVFRVFSVPGHTAGSAAYLVYHVLFLGDSADTARDGSIIGAPWLFSEDRAQNRASVAGLADRLAKEALEVKAIVFSHSGALDKGLAPLTAFAEKR